MLVYVAHVYSNDESNIAKAAKITHDLQMADPDNTYICPLLAFSHLKYGELGEENDMRICLDLLSECDKMIVASKVSKGVRQEISHCDVWGIPVRYLTKE
jgi:hypothetical protein